MIRSIKRFSRMLRKETAIVLKCTVIQKGPETMALAWLHWSAGLPEPLLVACMISIHFKCVSSTTLRDNFAYFSIKIYVVGTHHEYPQHMFLWRTDKKRSFNYHQIPSLSVLLLLRRLNSCFETFRKCWTTTKLIGPNQLHQKTPLKCACRGGAQASSYALILWRAN